MANLDERGLRKLSTKEFLRQARQVPAPLRVTNGKQFRLKDLDPSDTTQFGSDDIRRSPRRSGANSLPRGSSSAPHRDAVPWVTFPPARRRAAGVGLDERGDRCAEGPEPDGPALDWLRTHDLRWFPADLPPGSYWRPT